MLGWIFKKNTAIEGDKTAPAAPAPTPQPPAEAAPAVDWPERLQAALGDPAALLALARSTGAPLSVQQAAIDGVTDEAALKRAEREWRGQDRRLHRLVKQRHLAQVATREAREQAARLITEAEALQHESPIPTNRLVELDRGWSALDATRLEPAQRERYTVLVAQLTALTRERGDEALKLQRWAREASDTRAALLKAMNDAASGPFPRDVLAAAATAARAVVESAPEVPAAGAARTALESALALAQHFGNHLTLLDDLLAASAAAVAQPLARWDERVPLADARLAELLDQQVAQWRSAREASRHDQRAAQRALNREHQRETAQGQADALTAALDQGEAALAEGHLAEAHRHLVGIDEALGGAAAPAALVARIDRLQAEYAQLKGWQHWAGGVARDELVLQAEALAAVSQREPASRGVKLSVRQQAEVIDDMRARWKELDRLGGATSRALWQRFDSALKTAWQPVADHQAQQRAAREVNLQARVALIDTLDAVPLPTPTEAGTAPDWKPVAGALEHFRAEWRKLGPLEHTVPHKARAGLVERHDNAAARLEAPLGEARRVAQAARERLVERARMLADQAAAGTAGTAGRDSIDRVRELQAEWQQQARTLPLARAAEGALWSAFKAATDAVFQAREAAFSARDAQFKAAAAERLALIEQLEGLDADLPAAALKRALAEADAQWQRSAPSPRQEAATLENRWRAAQTRWREHLAGSVQRQWQAQVDALAARLAECDAADDSAEPATARQALQGRWPTLAALPPAWEAALARRIGLQPARPAKGPLEPVDELMLKLELAAGLASPAANEAARRELKLQALKSALEGRQAGAVPDAAQRLVDLLERAPLDAAQRTRRAAIVAGLRAGEPLTR